MKFIGGLVSVSFRQLSYNEIINTTLQSGLQAIEWGGDIHVPAGNIELAKTVGNETAKRGIIIPEYGSYYTLGSKDTDKSDASVDSARALGTSTIRIWASNKNRASLTKEEYISAVEDAQRLCRENSDINFCLECHNGTITEEYHDTLNYLKDVGCDNLQMFWQPNQFRDHEYNISSLEALLPYIRSAHVFAWEKNLRFPLASHENRWRDYLSVLKNSPSDKVFLMLEFMHDNSPLSLPDTAKTLNNLIAKFN